VLLPKRQFCWPNRHCFFHRRFSVSAQNLKTLTKPILIRNWCNDYLWIQAFGLLLTFHIQISRTCSVSEKSQIITWHNVEASYSNGPRCPSVCLSVRPTACHTRISPKLRKMDLCLLGNSIGIWASWFKICHQIRDRKYGSAIVTIFASAVHPLSQKWWT